MNIKNIEKKLKLKIDDVRLNEPMKYHTTFKIGGPADLMVVPKKEEEVVYAIEVCREEKIDFMMLGNGSNLLVRDGGIRGVVIKLNEDYANMSIHGDKIYCESGTLMTAVSRYAMDNCLTGLEFCNGIPGTLGGAATMNAGAYGGEMKDVISKVRVLDLNNEVKEYNNEEMNFRYRGSRVGDESLVVLGVEFQLKEGEYEDIKEIMDDLKFKRTSKQPLNMPSGGSTFKRPEGYFAAKLIDDSGLRGLTHKGCQVSEKHCGFVVNHDNATCNDVLELIKIIQKTVKDKFDVDLETEIKIIGEDL